MMHTIAEAQSSSSQTSMTKRPALVVIRSDIQQRVRFGRAPFFAPVSNGVAPGGRAPAAAGGQSHSRSPFLPFSGGDKYDRQGPVGINPYLQVLL